MKYRIKYVELLATGLEIGLDGTIEDVIEFARSKGALDEFEEFLSYTATKTRAELHLDYVDQGMIDRFSAMYQKITGEEFDPNSAMRDVTVLPLNVEKKDRKDYK